MVFVANAIIDDCTMVIEAFHAPHASHAMDRALGPYASAKETEVVQVTILYQGAIKVLTESCQLD